LRPVDVDAETIGSGIDYFANSGIPNAVLQVRLNNPNRILYSILAQTGISLGEGANSFGWGLLDEMAAARVKGQPYESLREEALSEVAQWKQEDRLPVEAERFLTTLIIEGRYDMELLEQSFPDAYRAVLELAELKQRLSEKYPDATIQIDPLSTRMSYSETAWQYDVVSGQDTFAELGGGGVYTRVAALSWEKQFGQPAPKNLRCAGFAVGVMRADTVKQILAAKERNDG